jgi:hypothetical protein
MISTAKSTGFVKFRSRHAVHGIDRRTLFYGCEGVEYDSRLWESLSSDTETVEKDGIKDRSDWISDVGLEEAQMSWTYLIETFPFPNQLWTDLVIGLVHITDNNCSPNAGKGMSSIIHEFIAAHPCLSDADVVQHVRTIFERHAVLDAERRRSQTSDSPA